MPALAIITARGASKRIPRKNIRPFLGRPILHYSIEVARRAGCFTEVMVSTDDAEIAEVARAAGAVVPFFRSARTSDDWATTADVLVEVLEEYGRRGRAFAMACCLYPTAPFVTAEALATGYRLLQQDPAAETVMPVVKFGYPILRAVKIVAGHVHYIWPEHMQTRSQDLPPAYHDAAQFYWFRVEPFLRARRLVTERTLPMILPEQAVQDIDTVEDWALAELKYQMLHGQPDRG